MELESYATFFPSGHVNDNSSNEEVAFWGHDAGEFEMSANKPDSLPQQPGINLLTKAVQFLHHLI